MTITGRRGLRRRRRRGRIRSRTPISGGEEKTPWGGKGRWIRQRDEARIFWLYDVMTLGVECFWDCWHSGFPSVGISWLSVCLLYEWEAVMDAMRYDSMINLILGPSRICVTFQNYDEDN